MKELSGSAHPGLTFGRHGSDVEALRSLYERVELRLWGLLPTRMRRRLTTYGIAEMIASPPLDSRDTSRITVSELLEFGSPDGGLDHLPPAPRAERGPTVRELADTRR
jgi:hypothetical protein